MTGQKVGPPSLSPGAAGDTNPNGKEGAFDRRYQFTDTWLRRNGQWQIIAAQDYLIRK